MDRIDKIEHDYKSGLYLRTDLSNYNVIWHYQLLNILIQNFQFQLSRAQFRQDVELPLVFPNEDNRHKTVKSVTAWK